MVMYRRGIPLVPAELLGYHLGLIVPEEDLPLFWKARSGEKPRAGWGTQISRAEFEPNGAFQRLGIPLTMKLRLIDEFEQAAEVRDYLEQAEQEDKDVLVCYDYGTLFGTGVRNGHINVFDRLTGGRVRLVDPERTVPKWRVVEVDKLFEAMKAHGPGRSGGFWELKKR